MLLELLLIVAVRTSFTWGQVLVPPYTNLALDRKIEASSTCGELNGQPIKEIFCQIAGSSQYTPLNQYSYSTGEDEVSVFAELKMEKQSFVQGGQMCDFCQSNSSFAHPATNMVDGRASWWQSPPLSRGMQYNQINISINLEQEFHVAYVWIQMANSPRPGSWVLERSIDGGKTYMPWQYFAETPAECDRLFGRHTLQPILEDDTVICTHEFSGIHPMENAEIMINLLENRPGKHNFSHSQVLQNFTRATNVRLRLLRTKTLHGHLMDVNRRDPTVTRRYFYAIKEIFMGGRCVCNGHADTCDILDVRRSNILLCRCEHNTCGDHCEYCCPGFEQKMWQRSKEGAEFVCEPCNCHGHSKECVYEKELDRMHSSLDIHGNYDGGGRCLNCKDNTEGINCNKCIFGYYRPRTKWWNETDVCQPCVCDPAKHTGDCEDETGRCICKPQFTGVDCDRCAPGHYSPPECKPCDCSINGTLDDTCLPVSGRCPCKSNYGGELCQVCAPGYTNLTAGCISCKCDELGSLHNNCNESTAQCMCKTNFAGLTCDSCADGYFGDSLCEYCDCDTTGTEDSICDKQTGACLCKSGFSGSRCDGCNLNFYGYPYCKECDCDEHGSKSTECDRKNGDCRCYANFTSKNCDRCAAGFYDFPNCKPCSCLAIGSKGMTCDNNGQCYCKPNFQGEKCDQCKTNFYNFPICEECNCNPKGVVAGFAGCDKVEPGELCTCKMHVTGRICDQCKPTYWDLQYHHEDGCIQCDCNLNGTLLGLNECSTEGGQCNCKRNVAGRRCDKCADGFFQLEMYNQFECQACNCDVGGALGIGCDMQTGECRCRPRITGQKCDRPIENHYFPTLWHNKYEAEDGISMEQNPVRFAIDKNKFPNYSWRGYVVFSPIQEDILLDITVSKASLYRLLFHYINPTDVQINTRVVVMPLFTHTQDVEQRSRLNLPATSEPTTVAVNPKQPFILNPGKWRIKISTKQRFFLDYVVLLPSEYYEGTVLKERIFEPCKAFDSQNTICFDSLYPPLPLASRADVTKHGFIMEEQNDSSTVQVEKIPIKNLPGDAAFVRADNENRKIRISLKVPEDDYYILLLEYYNADLKTIPLTLEVRQYDQLLMRGIITLKHCPYSTFCRDVALSDAGVALIHMKDEDIEITLTIEPKHEFGLGAVNLIRMKDWDVSYLQQVPVCVRKNGHCIGQWFPPVANGILNEVEFQMNANNSISGEKLPFIIANPEEVQVMALDENMGTVEVSGIVPSHGHYVFIVQYFNPDNTLLTVDVTLQNGHLHHAEIPFSYCPSIIGCRAVIRDKERRDVIQFFIDDKYTASFYFNESQKGPLYIDSITSLPFHSYSDTLLTPLPVDVSMQYIQECSSNNFKNDPSNVSEYCRQKVFSLTSEYNMAALPCECSSQGSTSFMCEEYGGECPCRPNIIGRQCDRCAPGYYSFPDCIKCRCPDNHLCDENTGQCFCPPHVQGKNCDSCVPYAFGYDPLIGCQLCGCQQNGSEARQLQCDPDNGQCLCRVNVGGRKCDKCLPGFYGFPHCYECACEIKGTTEEICESTNAACKCKKNVVGENCDICRPGTFDLRASNSDGCAECFCFGATDRCRSSFLPVTFVNFDEEAWKVYPNDSVLHSYDKVIYKATTDDKNDVYFLAPIGSGHDFTISYGLQLSFVIASNPRDGETKMSSAPDVQLVGNNTVLDFWAREQPANPRIPFSVEIKLLPENFMESTGEPTTRDTLMMVLHDLDELRIKACYYTNCEVAAISELQLEIAKDDQTTGDSYTASSVEICQCPPPYSGLSCQQCSPGYYRVNNGRYLGSCVPCNCNGHSGSCDPTTGICFDCEHDTFGDHCEFCRVGFYGDATKGGPYSCLSCACPYATDTNNFATSCQVSETGLLKSCFCKQGYTSDYCERCDVGYYGQPTEVGGSCHKCDCNNNNDLSVDGSCHPITGDCYLCLNNTDGARCEHCKPWFYGDAVEAKNCTDCACNQCGSLLCDNKSGRCECLANVEGEKCDRCVANAWGFMRCHGCEMCNCALASSNPQCDVETGQCSCMPGAAGQMCEICEYGYWNYGPTGCSKCDCEADLSMGTVCDVNTGQCHCQEGATGPRCDQCASQYLRIPNFGCRLCDECVHSVMHDLDRLADTVDFVNETINNISTTALTGTRLKRIRKKIDDVKPIVVNHMDSASDMGVESLSNDIFGSTSDVFGIVVRANRSLDTLSAIDDTMSNIINRTNIFPANVFDRVEMAASTVDSLKNLVFSLGKDSSAIDRQKWLMDSTSLLQKIRDTANDEEARKRVEDENDEVQKLLKRMRELKDEENIMHEKYFNMKDQMNELVNNITEYRSFLYEVDSSVENTLQQVNNSNIRYINSVQAGVKAGEAKIKETHTIISSLTAISETFIESLNNLSKTLHEIMSNVQDVFNQLSTMKGRYHHRRIRDINKNEYRNKSKELENQALFLSSLFGRTRTEAKNAVAAVNGYKELMKHLKKARNMTNQASLNAEQARKFHEEGAVASAKTLREQSADLLRTAVDLKQSTVNSVDNLKVVFVEKASELQSLIEKQRRILESLRPKFDDGEVNAKLEHSLTASEETRTRIDNTIFLFDRFKPDLEEMTGRSKKFVESILISANDVDTAREQISKLVNESSPVMEELEMQKKAASNTSATIEHCREKLNLLKEKIALTRDLANRIKLGAHFEKGSILELPLSPRITRSAAYTNIEFFFRTTNTSGLILFFGNELGVAGTRALPTDDYVAIEVEKGHLRVVINLGDTPTQLISNSSVTDGNWRKVAVDRVGKTITLRVSSPNSANYEEEKIQTIGGFKSVLNLHQKKSRLFIGGIVPGVNISPDVHNREFSGDIEDLRIHGETVGLWNAKKGGNYNVQGVTKKIFAASSLTDEIALSFNGDGYAVHKLSIWNPRKQTIFSLTFQTYSPDGLFLYLGKERDFLSLELQDGRVKLSFDFGSGVGRLTSIGSNYNDGKPHSVYVHRLERHALMKVDDNDVSEGDSPGTMFELSLSDVFYLGGVPSDVSTRTTVVPMNGCIEHVKLDNRLMDLSKSRTAKGVQLGCSARHVRVISMVSERSTATFSTFNAKKDYLEMTFRFKTNQPSGILASVISDEQEVLFQLRYQDGFISAEYGSDNKDVAEIEFRSVADGQWHYFAAVVKPETIRLDVDDLYSSEIHRTVADNEVIGVPIIVQFGRSLDSNLHFEGCIGDATYNGQLLDFAEASTKGVSLTGCSFPEDISTTDMLPEQAPTNEPVHFAIPGTNNIQPLVTETAKEITAENRISAGTSSLSKLRGIARKLDECALPRRSYGDRPDSSGIRFGLSPSSRLEFDKPPASFDKNSLFSVQLRATASNGIIMFTTNHKHTDYLALYLVNGIVHFAYNSGSGQAILKSNRTVMDDEWHSIRAEREGLAGTLYIDNLMEANGQSPPGTDAVDTQPPIYIGGLPSDLVPFASRILLGAKSVFGGCLRDFKLNEMKFDVPPAEIGTVPCNQYTEEGLYFGENGGYAILNKNLKVGSSFNIELEVRPRTKTAVLLSVGILEYLTLQFFNGTVKFTVDNGAGPETVTHVPSMSNALCDGHWHHIKLYKTKNLMTLTVDGRSNLNIMKKGKKTDTNTKDPLYLGGVPKGIRSRGLETTEGFLGCVRVLNMGKKPRKRKNVDLSQVSLFGDITRNSCPIN
ncbi:Laminin EGF-like (Domains III and V) family protein [Acanthocheilonema viteae]